MHRKNRPILFAGLCGCAGFAAHAAMTFLGQSTLLASPPTLVPIAVTMSHERSTAADGAEVRRASTPQRHALRRNVFCPGCPANAAAAFPSEATSSARQTTLNLMLVGTMEGIGGEPSFATVYDADAHAIGLYTVTDTIRPEVIVASVERGRLHLIHGDHREVLMLGARAPPSQPPTAPNRDPPRADKIGMSDKIRCTGDSLCVVDRALVDELVANPSMLIAQARVVPRGAEGFALYGIRRGSLPKLLGLNNGDAIVSLNGQPLDSVDDVMRLYAELRNASRLEVKVKRRGQTLTKEIQIE